MAPKYKLTYFNGRARAEVTRLIFAHAGVDYEDERIERADWPQRKASTPLGQMPVFEIDGVAYCQSNAISRYLAKEYGLYGKTPEDGLRIDMIVDTVEDMLKPLLATFSMDDAKKAEAKKKYEDEQLPASLQTLEKLLVANKGGGGFLVGDQLSWADLMVLNWCTWPSSELFGIKVDLSKVPKLEALNERVKSLPRIAAWLEKRPETGF